MLKSEQDVPKTTYRSHSIDHKGFLACEYSIYENGDDYEVYVDSREKCHHQGVASIKWRSSHKVEKSLAVIWICPSL